MLGTLTRGGKLAQAGRATAGSTEGLTLSKRSRGKGRDWGERRRHLSTGRRGSTLWARTHIHTHTHAATCAHTCTRVQTTHKHADTRAHTHVQTHVQAQPRMCRREQNCARKGGHRREWQE